MSGDKQEFFKHKGHQDSQRKNFALSASSIHGLHSPYKNQNPKKSCPRSKLLSIRFAINNVKAS